MASGKGRSSLTNKKLRPSWTHVAKALNKPEFDCKGRWKTLQILLEHSPSVTYSISNCCYTQELLACQANCRGSNDDTTPSSKASHDDFSASHRTNRGPHRPVAVISRSQVSHRLNQLMPCATDSATPRQFHQL